MELTKTDEKASRKTMHNLGSQKPLILTSFPKGEMFLALEFEEERNNIQI